MKCHFKSYLLILSVLIILISSCSKKETTPPPNNKPALTITALSVTSGPFNTSVVITGTAFNTNMADDKVFFNGKAATITTATATQLTAIVPVGAGTGNVTVSVNNGAAVSGPVFTYQLSAVVSTLAGSTAAGSADGKGAVASFSIAYGITSDASGNLYVAGKNDFLVRKITPDGTVSTLAGNGTVGKADGKGTDASFSEPLYITFGPDGNLYLTDFIFGSVRKITLAGDVTTMRIITNNTGITNPFSTPGGVVASDGNLYIANYGFSYITKLNNNGLATIFTGADQHDIVDGGHGIAQLSSPQGMKIDQNGTIYFVDANAIRKVDKDALVTTLAGNKAGGDTDGTGLAARFNGPRDLAIDKDGNIYITDTGNRLIRKLGIDGIVSTVAGNAALLSSQDGVSTSAGFQSPTGICIDSNGVIYVTDHNEVRKIIFE